MLVVVGACGDETDSGPEFVNPPEPRERQGEVTAPPARDPEVGPSGEESRPRTARIGAWSMPKRDWPLSVREGVIRCQERDGRAVVTFVTPDAKVYGLNEAALSQGLARIDPIWRREPGLAGDRAPIAPLLEQGLRLCE